MSSALDRVMAWSMEGVRLVAEGFTTPDQEFSYMALFLDAQPDTPLTIPLEPEWFMSRKRQRELASTHVPALIRQHRPKAVAVVSPAWIFPAEMEDLPMEMIERESIYDGVMVIAADSHAHAAIAAHVIRSPVTLPQLGEWSEDVRGIPENLGKKMQHTLKEVAQS